MKIPMISPYAGRHIESIKKIAEELDRALLDSATRMPEDIFRDFFLDLFAGRAPDNDPDINFRVWMQISGGPGRPVFVTEVGNPDVILFEVPPLNDVGVVDLHNRSNVNVSAIMANAANISVSNPKLGQKFLEENLNEVINGTLDKEKIRAKVEKLNIIFARYNYPLIGDILPDNKDSHGTEDGFDFLDDH